MALQHTIRVAALFWLPGLAFSAEADTFFETQIRPLLADRCLGCHGAKKQEGGLRLDTKAGWERGGDSGKAVVIPGDAAASPLMSRVRHADPEKRMPYKKDPLSKSEIAALETWIAQGAHDPRTGAAVSEKNDAEVVKRHWAFQPLSDPPIPMKEGMIGEATGLDRFVFAKLAAQPGLKVNPPADRATLVRRVTFDLTGLPPTPAEIELFLDDPADEAAAFAKLVDRLLESPAYGERWGRHWLDVARYADTAGDGADYPVREAVKYRDWVVRAFNADQPFDEFIREQIAGDILAKQGPPERFADRVTATGFLAIGKRYGYAPVPDYQHLDFADAIDSVGRSLLGLSLGCARCHDHKYDPVSIGEYYGLYGIFQSTKWSFPGGEVQKRPSDFPALIAPEEVAKLEEEKAAALTKLDAHLAKLKADRASLDGNSFAGGVDLGLEAQAIGKSLGAPWLGQGPQTVMAEAQSPFTHVHPKGMRGIRVGSGQPNEGIRYAFASPLKADTGKPIHFTIDFRTVAPVAADQKGAYRFYLGQGVARSAAVDFSITASEIAIRNGTNWETIRRLEPGKWQTLRVTIDPAAKTVSGVVGVPGDLTEFFGKAIGMTWNGTIDTFICDAIGHVAGPAPARDLDNLGLQLEKPFAVPGSGPVMPREAAVPADLSSKIKELDTAIADATKSREGAAVREWYPVAYGVSEGQPVNAKIQLRGEPEKPGDEAARRFLTLLGGDAVSDADKGSGRLDLAHWLTRPTNPLTARVFVNRVWQWHFGQGLVTTPSDFGLRGEAPSHPELLDWLTSRFVESGWSVKALHRLILNTLTYRRSSDDEAGNLRIDPGNRWLWRYARHPLDAESIRDAMLAVSGLLDRSIGGPHPFPPVETWKYTIHNPFHAVYDSDHRSLYLMVQRNRRHPYLALFDAADPNQSVPSRLPTTTPTQSLYLMNSPFVHRNAAAFARKIVESSGDERQRVRFAFVTAQGNAPAEEETRDALAFLDAYRVRFAGAEKPSGDPDEAAWAALARVLLTANAFLYVD
jgi:mono/diheme cytochrome c family protein